MRLNSCRQLSSACLAGYIFCEVGKKVWRGKEARWVIRQLDATCARITLWRIRLPRASAPLWLGSSLYVLVCWHLTETTALGNWISVLMPCSLIGIHLSCLYFLRFIISSLIISSPSEQRTGPTSMLGSRPFNLAAIARCVSRSQTLLRTGIHLSR